MSTAQADGSQQSSDSATMGLAGPGGSTAPTLYNRAMTTTPTGRSRMSGLVSTLARTSRNWGTRVPAGADTDRRLTNHGSDNSPGSQPPVTRYRLLRSLDGDFNPTGQATGGDVWPSAAALRRRLLAATRDEGTGAGGARRVISAATTRAIPWGLSPLESCAASGDGSPW